MTPEGVTAQRWWSVPVSPDGAWVIAHDPNDAPTMYSTRGEPPRPVRGLMPDELCATWTADGRALLVARGGGLPWIIERLELDTGRRTPVREIRAREGSGLRLSTIAITPDGRSYVRSYSRLLSDLFVVEGLR